MKTTAISAIALALLTLSLSGCESQAQSHEATTSAPHAEGAHAEGTHEEGEHHKHTILVTSPVRKDMISTQRYVCQIHSCRHIEVRALKGGYLEEIHVKEGQAVKKGEVMFKILPVLYQAKLASEVAEAQRIQIELKNAEDLSKKGIVSAQAVALKAAELAKAKANVALAQAEMNFADVKAPFDGIVDRQNAQLGSLIDEGDMLTTMSDNSLMWVYFNVPESAYLAYKAELAKDQAEQGATENSSVNDEHLHIELRLANGQIFNQHGEIGAIEADFNNTTGNIAFRADFPNPEGLLRNGQTGTIMIHRTMKNVVVIPQRAKFDILAKQYVFVVDKDNVVRQRDIKVGLVEDDVFVIDEGLEESDKIILEGIRQVRDGEKTDYEFRDPKEVFKSLKYHAE